MTALLQELDPSSRLEQLHALRSVRVQDSPLLIHGSIAKAALMGENLPAPLRPDGRTRDIDVFSANGAGKLAVETMLDQAGLVSPNPIDAGLCGVLVRDGADTFAQKGCVRKLLRGAGVLEEIQEYELRDTEGVRVRSFSPAGMLVTHLLHQPLYRQDHYVEDQKFISWFERREVELPRELADSINEFHIAHQQAYPPGKFLTLATGIYASLVPETTRSKLRPYTHKLRQAYADRRAQHAEVRKEGLL